ncbi:MAG: hypothetical protein V3573_05715 [Desulfovibrionaceae bacterium]
MVPVRFLSAVLALAVAVLISLAAQAAGPGYPTAPPPADFRGMVFGAPLESMPGLRPVADRMPASGKGFEDVYYREKESTSFGQAEILSVAYYFHKDRLRSVVVTMQGDVNAFMVKDKLIELYGPGRQAGPRYGWTWDAFSLVLGPAERKDVHALTYTLERLPEEN